MFSQHLPPLAERVRPQSLEHYVGQQHLVGPGGALRLALERRYLPSLLFWGPPGTGKTTLVRLLAQELERPLNTLSAVQSGVKDVRAALEAARQRPGALLFIDEIHRFNKAQQDALLHGVESGLVTLVGATTENPSFEVIPALRSRCQLYVLNPLSQEEVVQILQQALARDAELRKLQVELAETEALYRLSGGDARRALNLLEITVHQQQEQPPVVTNQRVQQAAQQQLTQYDKDGEHHYDVISAFIKSIRGGDPNGALYWLAVMLEGGEDPRFICRRLLISASEDIGNANPNALLLANACFQAVDAVGLPEGRIVLAQTVTYLAASPKSNASYLAIGQAQQQVRQQGALPVPLHLRNAPTQLMKDQGYSAGYKYSHNFDPQDPQALQNYLPEQLRGHAFYYPKPIGREAELQRSLYNKWGQWYGYGKPDEPTSQG